MHFSHVYPNSISASKVLTNNFKTVTMFEQNGQWPRISHLNSQKWETTIILTQAK